MHLVQLQMGTTINIEPAVRDRLKTFGIAGETYNDILTRLMDNADRDAFVREVQEVLAHPEKFNWTRLEDIE